MLWPPAAAISSARFASSCPRTSARSGPAEDGDVDQGAADEGGQCLLALGRAVGQQQGKAVDVAGPAPDPVVELAAQCRDLFVAATDLKVAVRHQQPGDRLFRVGG